MCWLHWAWSHPGTVAPTPSAERDTATDAVSKATLALHTGARHGGGGSKMAETAQIEAVNLRRKQVEGLAEVGEPLVLVPAQAMAAANVRRPRVHGVMMGVEGVRGSC